FSYPFYREFRERNQMFSNIAAIHSVVFGTHGKLGGNSDTEKVAVELVSGSYFDTLGIRPAVGRLISEGGDVIAGAPPGAVASYSWWQRRLGANPASIGETITINSTIYTLIGVAPP